jgi:hypothetical protein
MVYPLVASLSLGLRRNLKISFVASQKKDISPAREPILLPVEKNQAEEFIPENLFAAFKQIIAQSSEQPAVAVGRDGPDAAHDGFPGQHRQESQTDERIGQQAAAGEIFVLPGNEFIKIRNQQLHLRTHAADQEIPIAGHLPKGEGRAGFQLAVRLGQGR